MLHLQLDERVRTLRALTGGSTSCGWMYDEIGLLLYSLVKFYKPALVVQTGHLWGKSSCVVLEALTDGFLTGGQVIEDCEQRADKAFSDFVATHAAYPYETPKVISVDPNPLDVPDPVRGVEHLRQTYGVHFDFYKMMSNEFFRSHGVPLATQFRGKRILGIVDGDHSPEGCLADLTSMRALGAGMIFLDDTRWLPHIGSTGRAFGRKYGYDFLELPNYNGVAVLHKRAALDAGTSSRLRVSPWTVVATGARRVFRRLRRSYSGRIQRPGPKAKIGGE